MRVGAALLIRLVHCSLILPSTTISKGCVTLEMQKGDQIMPNYLVKREDVLHTRQALLEGTMH